MPLHARRLTKNNAKNEQCLDQKKTNFATETREKQNDGKVLTGHFEGFGSAPSYRGGEELKLDHSRFWTYFSRSVGELEALLQRLAPHLRASS